MYPNLYHREPSVKEYKYPVIDSEDQDKDNPCIIYIPIPKNTQRLYVDPTGKYIICCGLLTSDIIIVSFEKVDVIFDKKLNESKDCIIAKFKIGLGPASTIFDNNGNAYTSLIYDSIICKWNIEKTIKGIDPVLQKLYIKSITGELTGTRCKIHSCNR